jgi:pimeloyl-ACP methyl ester carboxylesterase
MMAATGKHLHYGSMDNSSEQILLLPDGRRLSWGEYGDPRGKPVLYFHGIPGSRHEALLLEPGLAGGGIRLIAVNRPGFGSSDLKTGRRFTDWPSDVIALAGVGPLDARGATRGMSPGNVLIFKYCKYFPGLLAGLFRSMTGDGLEKSLDNLIRSMSLPDKELLKQSRLREIVRADLSEALAGGPDGIVYEVGLYSETWGFDPAEITMSVTLWHGGEDRNVPPRMSHRMGLDLKNCQLRFFPEEGHFSLIHNRAAEIIKTVACA